MRFAELPAAAARRALRAGTLALEVGPFVYRLRTSVDLVAERVHAHYGEFPLASANDFADFEVAVDAPNPLRRWFHANVEFRIDGHVPFRPLPRAHAFALLESGMNWCVAQEAHTYLVVHAAVVARDGRAVLMPAPPGSGKSTLCAGLINRGWRLLSDELALIRFDDARIAPCPRPVSLKNESIALIRGFAPGAAVVHTADDTVKGTVCHMTPPADSVQRAGEPAEPRWIVFPRYLAGEPAALRSHGQGRAFMALAENAFNYNIAGVRGYETLCRVVERSRCLEFAYSDLEEAIRVFDALADEP